MVRFSGLHYTINETPPWTTTIVLGFQQYLVLLSSTLPTPGIIASIICADHSPVIMSELLGNILIASGLATLLQDTLGSRLPIIQCPSYAFIVPMLALIQVDAWKCPKLITEVVGIVGTSSSNNVTYNETMLMEETSSRMQMLTGTIMVAAVVEVIIGFTGLVGLLLKLIGPLTVSPTLILIGLSLTENAATRAGSNWMISVITIALIILLSEWLPVFNVQLPSCGKKSGDKKKTPIVFHKLFSVIIAVCIMWFVCYILTITDTIPNNPEKYGYHARTDIRSKAIADAEWFRVPYPGEWGAPKFNAAMFVGLFAGVFTSIIESIGDYYACSRLAGAPPPPAHAINRGIMCEGFGCMISGILSNGSGVTSCSQNIGTMSLTKVGSRRVGQMAGLLLIIFGCFGKFSALIISMPDPIIGSSFIVLFGIIAAVGASNLQYANMNSSRNILVFGMALFLGLVVPNWAVRNGHRIKTGNENADHVINVLLGTSMFVGCVVGLILDNVLPGTPEERGIAAWQVEPTDDDDTNLKKDTVIAEQKAVYDIPFRGGYFQKLKWTKFLPFCANFKQPSTGSRNRKSSLETSGLYGSTSAAEKEISTILISSGTNDTGPERRGHSSTKL